MRHHQQWRVAYFSQCPARPLRNETSVFSPTYLTDSAAFDRDKRNMRTFVAVLVLALITIAFEVYSDAQLTSAEVPYAAPDRATVAIAHGLKHG
jgi:steroid 5-alpha reductase family enzyme